MWSERCVCGEGGVCRGVRCVGECVGEGGMCRGVCGGERCV